MASGHLVTAWRGPQELGQRREPHILAIDTDGRVLGLAIDAYTTELVLQLGYPSLGFREVSGAASDAN